MNTIENTKREYSVKGTLSNPCTEEEHQQLLAEGKDIACYVEGRGFCAPAAMAPPTTPGSSSDPSDPSEADPGPVEPVDADPNDGDNLESSFSTVNLRAGEYVYRPIEFPVCIELKISWDEGVFQATSQPVVHAEILCYPDHPDYRNYTNQSVPTASWGSDFNVEVSGAIRYETRRCSNGMISRWRTVEYSFHERHQIESQYLTTQE